LTLVVCQPPARAIRSSRPMDTIGLALSRITAVAVDVLDRLSFW
jgi:hypothetical protein